MTTVSLRQSIDAKCRDCGGQEGGDRHWRVHTSVCPITACPLWRARPLASRNVPLWLAARDPAALPHGFTALTQLEAIALVRGAGALMQHETGDNSEAVVSQECPEGGER
jgi:hypothetical protein